MANKIKVKPAHKDLKVRNPFNMMFLAGDEFTEVDESSYWVRRIQSGDVIKENQGEKPAKK